MGRRDVCTFQAAPLQGRDTNPLILCPFSLGFDVEMPVNLLASRTEGLRSSWGRSSVVFHLLIRKARDSCLI